MSFLTTLLGWGKPVLTAEYHNRPSEGEYARWSPVYAPSPAMVQLSAQLAVKTVHALGPAKSALLLEPLVNSELSQQVESDGDFDLHLLDVALETRPFWGMGLIVAKYYEKRDGSSLVETDLANAPGDTPKWEGGLEWLMAKATQWIVGSARAKSPTDHRAAIARGIDTGIAYLVSSNSWAATAYPRIAAVTR